MVTATARPRVFWVQADTAVRERVSAWPVGPALLELLGEINAAVRTTVAD